MVLRVSPCSFVHQKAQKKVVNKAPQTQTSNQINLFEGAHSKNYFYNNLDKRPYKFISFYGRPISLMKGDVSSANEAIRLWNVLGKQQFCDTGDDNIHQEYKLIRENNYSFLDELYSDKEKRIFIDNFKRVTKFPDMIATSENIEKEFINGAKKSEYINNTNTRSNSYDILCAGYNNECSVGKRKALPGSDIDDAFIVIRGSQYGKDEDIVNNFKKELWFNTDQRILSYNHPDSFPQVYTLKQIENLCSITQDASSSIPENVKKTQTDISKSYLNDYVQANPYFLALSQKFKKEGKYNKEEIKNFGFFTESVKNGKILYNTDRFSLYLLLLGDSDIFQYSNLSQIKALHNENYNKPKLQNRDILCQNFEKMEITEQYEFVKNIIKNMSEDNDENMPIYKKGTDNYNPLIQAITGENSYDIQN